MSALYRSLEQQRARLERLYRDTFFIEQASDLRPIIEEALTNNAKQLDAAMRLSR